MQRNLGHINGYAEGTDGAVFVAGMISIAFGEKDTHSIVRKAALLLHPDSPYRKCLDQVTSMADAGRSPQEIFRAVDERWGIEYPATNNAVVNLGIVAASVWFGDGDYQETLQLAIRAADFADTDCNAANSAAVVAAMHGMKALPAEQIADLDDRIVGSEMGPLKLTPPVDESIVDLAKRTAKIGASLVASHGARDDGNNLTIVLENPVTQPAELFQLGDLMQYWNKDWTLARARFGGAGGGMRGIRGITYLDGDVLCGVVLSRVVGLGPSPALRFKAGVDVGRSWQLQAYVNDKKVLDRLVDGLYESVPAEGRQWEDVVIDLSEYHNQKVVLRLYQRVPHSSSRGR